MDMNFTNLQELYNRLKPALLTKKEEMRRVGIDYIKEEDIWNYFKETKWVKATDLSLYQMVSDVLNTDNILIEDYLKQKIRREVRIPNFDE